MIIDIKISKTRFISVQYIYHYNIINNNNDNKIENYDETVSIKTD